MAFDVLNGIWPEWEVVRQIGSGSFGVFGGCHAVYVNGPFAYADAFTTEIVGGLKFVYPNSHTMRIYRDGEIYTLPEAWDAGVISAEALGELHERFPNRDVRE